ncbi:hypothetical protein EN871_32395 [bacterium M00.F.Ca.ET.228.01.1.1]|uniref:spherulation-specific family 4 protein n=1 Tax=Paraburkholderia phenoliruptrix TaxID=252970 RepID=UPI0010929D63|nr:spherulation-specific family 4 protein [Paraburkholderia phenoliruptrix]TGP39505.1 hypothetical protein EN871_32395 [bacterium M00.F.Ca.ET.228.01.1.1]TGR95236.1 hypothetical protein EN834_32380 [bacterium M00.F.Ca.ET.191.01.1.1]TGT96066.1 hypothetical protein EN798_32390 [bacterium M00.F.Ca.ET.155.01.1.1]MBW0446159.1 spherulation-specific family 4 protein [Paraburkholderia phenoliruptrix]MBW9096582.1 spherulation-specific family 4 protein [Paraburkholderia phenoliruptrix]
MAVALLLGSVSSASSANDGATSLVVPAYFDATDGAANWNSLTNTALTVPTVAILNPHSGPGEAQDPNYAAAVGRLRAAGGKVLGYVYTSYATRSLADVVADINAYASQYEIDGFFIDEMTSDGDTSHLQYYQSIYSYIKGLNRNYTEMGNPGTNIPELYVTSATADQFVVFENTARKYARYQPMSWQAAYPISLFVHIIWGATAAQLPGILQYAKTHGAGGVYVTSFSRSNPYKALPEYWDDEVRYAAGPGP